MVLYGSNYKRQEDMHDAYGRPMQEPEVSNSKNEHYWSEYRRNYELSLQKRIEEDRAKILSLPTAHSVKPPRPHNPLRGNYDRPQDLWAHIDGAQSNNRAADEQQTQPAQHQPKTTADSPTQTSVVYPPTQSQQQHHYSQQQPPDQHQPLSSSKRELEYDQNILSPNTLNKYKYIDYYNSDKDKELAHPMPEINRYYNQKKPPLPQHPPQQQQFYEERPPQRYAQSMLQRANTVPELPPQQSMAVEQSPPPGISIEQMRYLNRMNKASLKQNYVYQRNLSKKDFISEKEKYARHLEKDAVVTGIPLSSPTRTSVKVGHSAVAVPGQSCMEMRNPEARTHLKEMLQLQIREKEAQNFHDEDITRQKRYWAHTRINGRASGGALRSSASAQMLPPISNMVYQEHPGAPPPVQAHRRVNTPLNQHQQNMMMRAPSPSQQQQWQQENGGMESQQRYL